MSKNCCCCCFQFLRRCDSKYEYLRQLSCVFERKVKQKEKPFSDLITLFLWNRQSVYILCKEKKKEKKEGESLQYTMPKRKEENSQHARTLIHLSYACNKRHRPRSIKKNQKTNTIFGVMSRRNERKKERRVMSFDPAPVPQCGVTSVPLMQ